MSEIMPEVIPAEEAPVSCGGTTFQDQTTLRIIAIFVILLTSLFGAMFPIVSMRVKALNVHQYVYMFMRYFGSGVIIATGFIHLLTPGFEYLGNPCLPAIWSEYPWPAGIAMMSIFAVFIVELVSHRWGASYLRRRGLKLHDIHSASAGAPVLMHTTHGLHVDGTPPASLGGAIDRKQSTDEEAHLSPSHADKDNTNDFSETAVAEIVGVGILEFGVIFHSMIIGLTLAVTDGFVILFIVIVFHQMFEGLGLGSRLAILPLSKKYNWVAYVGAALYASITPLGIAIGLGVRTTYDPESQTALVTSGILDSLSAGILIYTGLVELLAHDFIFNKVMASEASNTKVAFAVGSVMLGAALMALLGKWV